MTHERFEPSLGEKKSGKPDPKRSRRGAALFAAGLAFGSGAPKTTDAAQPSSSPPTEQTAGSNKVAEGMEALRQLQEQDAEQIKEQKLRERLKNFQWNGGFADPKFANPENLFVHTLTSEYIEWLIKNEQAETLLRYNPVTESSDFNREASFLGTTFMVTTGRNGIVSKKLDPKAAKIYLKYLIDNNYDE